MNIYAVTNNLFYKNKFKKNNNYCAPKAKHEQNSTLSNHLICTSLKSSINFKGLKNIADPKELEAIKENNLQEKYDILLASGENAEIASILTNIQILDDNKEDYKKIIAFLKHFKKEDLKISFIINYQLKDLESKEIHKLANFAEKTDIKNLKNLIGNDYTQIEILEFLKFHSKRMNKPDFTKENLTFLPNLTNFLENNYTDGDNIDKILNTFPKTSRRIGKIPADWLDKTKNDYTKIQNEIYFTIEKFANNENLMMLSYRLSKILNKNVNVNRIGSGSYGNVYLIEIENAQKVCLKIFKKDPYGFNIGEQNRHGEFIEPQVALYMSKHYGKDFAKFYFGNLGHLKKHDNKGFMVTEFLDKNSRKNKKSDEGKSYICEDADLYHNKINGIIYDFGAVFPLDEFKKKITSWTL